jgi:hypothetical protein
MPDYSKLFSQQAEKDQAVNRQNPNPVKVHMTEEDMINMQNGTPEENIVANQTGAPQTQPTQEQLQAQEQKRQDSLTPEQLADERILQNEYPIHNERNILPNNPYTWTPDYTERGYLEEIGTSFVRGFGKHVVGSTGQMLALFNGLVPGWDIKEGNMASRWLQEAGEQLAEQNQVYMPEELRDLKFDIKTLANPDLWSKQLAEYIPQVVEFILLSKGAGAATKMGARGLVRNYTKKLGKDFVEKTGKKVVKNTGDQVARGAKEVASAIGGQGERSLIYDSMGEATKLTLNASEITGGALSMNLLAGIQNGAHLVNEMAKQVDKDGNPKYNDRQLMEMAAGTVAHNLYWLPVDALSYGLVYAKSSGMWKDLFKPMRKNIGKAAVRETVFDAQQQLKVMSNSFAKQASPLLKFEDKALRTAQYLGKPVFEGLEETLQETWEDWSVKKALQSTTGKKIKYENYMDFYFSKENEATRVISFGLGGFMGGGSAVIDALNQKAEDQYKLYSKTQLLKERAIDGHRDQQTAQVQVIYDQLIDNQHDGNVDQEAFIEDLTNRGVILEDEKQQWLDIAEKIAIEDQQAKDLNVAGRDALMRNRADLAINEYSLKFHGERFNNAMTALEKEKGNMTRSQYKKKLQERKEEYEFLKSALEVQQMRLKQSIGNILSGEEGNINNIKTVEIDGKTVPIGLTPEMYKKYYQMSDEAVIELARSQQNNKGGNFFQKMADSVRNLFNKGKEEMPTKEEVGKKVSKAEQAIKDSKLYKNLFPDEETNEETDEGFDGKVIEFETKVPEPDVPTAQGATWGSYPIPELQDMSANIQEKIDATEDVDGKKKLQDLKEKVDQYIVDRTKEYNAEVQKRKAEKQSKTEPKEKPGRAARFAEDENQIEDIVSETVGDVPGKERLAKQGVAAVDKALNGIKATTEEDAKEAIKKLIAEDKGFIEQILKKGTPEYVLEESLLNRLKKLKKIDEEIKGDTKGKKEQKNRARTRVKNRKKKKIPLTEQQRLEQKAADRVNNQSLRMKEAWENKEVRDKIINIAKDDPKKAKSAQNSYERYLASTTKISKAGRRTLHQQITINYHLNRMFPNSKPQVYAMDNLYEAVGERALGYTIMGAVLIDEKVWNQDPLFMHEFGHIYYQLTPNEKETIEILKQAVKNTKLLEKLWKMYEKEALWAYEGYDYHRTKRKTISPYGQIKVPDIEQQKQQKHKNGRPVAYRLPIEKQPLILEELFVETLQGPLSRRFNKFFDPVKEPQRQEAVKGWFRFIKKSVNNEKDSHQNIIEAIDGENFVDNDLITHIAQNFVKELDGVDVTTKGRASLFFENDQAIFESEDQVLNELIAETRRSEQSSLRKYLSEIKPEKIGTVKKDYSVYYQRQEEEDFYGNENDHFDFDFDEQLSEVNDHNEKDEFAYWDKSFERANDKMNKVINGFVNRWNKEANLRQNQLLEAQERGEVDETVSALYTERITQEEITESLQDLAREYYAAPSFIRALQEESGVMEEFYNYITQTYDDALQRLRSAHWVYANSEVVMAIAHHISSEGNYDLKVKSSKLDTWKANFIASQMDKNSSLKANVISALQSNSVTEKNQAIKDLIIAAAPNYKIAKKILEHGHLEIEGRIIPIQESLKELFELEEREVSKADRFMNPDVTTATRVKNSFLKFAEAVISTGKKFGPTSVVVAPKGQNTSIRMFSNHLIKTMHNVRKDLALSDNAQDKLELQLLKNRFISKYSNKENIDSKTRARLRIPTEILPNPMIESWWDKYQEKGIMPSIALDLGTENDMLNKNRNYKESTAEQQLINETLQFLLKDQNGEQEYLGSMDIFGDSSRRFLTTLPVLKESKAHLAQMYQLYAAQSYDKNQPAEKQDQLMSFNEFKEALNNDVQDWIQYFKDNGSSLSKINNLQPFYVGDTLTKNGESFIRRFVFNRIANGFYMHNIVNPGVPLNSLVKRHKGNIAPVIALDPNLKVEMIMMGNQYDIPFDEKTTEEKNAMTEEELREYNIKHNEWKKNRVIMNDGMQYILEEDAEQIQAIGQGSVNLGRGYKLFSHSIERDNPLFRGQTAQMKGYTMVLSKEMVTTGKHQHLKPIYDLLKRRREKFIKWYENKYATYDYATGTSVPKKYNPAYRIDRNEASDNIKYIPIVTPVSAEKASLFTNKELEKFQKYATLESLRNEKNMEAYEEMLDKMFWVNGDFVGLDGSNFGPQQVMDKQYDQATFSIQALSSILAHQRGKEKFEAAKKIQDLIVDQKLKFLKERVLNEIDVEYWGDKKYTDFILKKVNKRDADPYTIMALLDGALAYSPHLSEFANNQIKRQFIDNGNNLAVHGTYGQVVSDMGYAFSVLEEGEVVRQGYINGSNTLNPYRRGANSTQEMEIILPRNKQTSDKTYTRERKSYIGNDAKKKVFDSLNKSEALKKEFKLNSKGDIDAFMEKHQIYADKFSTQSIGYYIPGEVVMFTRIPHNGPAFMGVGEVVGFNESDSNNIIVPSEYAHIVGSDNDGDALFVYQRAKSKDKNGKVRDNEEYVHWNEAFELMKQQWLSPDMYEMLTTPLEFEDDVNVVIDKINNKTGQNTANKKMMPFSPRHYKKQYNNSVIAKQTIGIAFDTGRTLNTLAAYNTFLTNGTDENNENRLTDIIINNKRRNRFADFGSGKNSRIHQSTVLANIVLDSTKNGHADALNLNINSISSAVILVNLGFNLEEVGMLLNHPAAKEYLELNKLVSNDYIDGMTEGVLKYMMHKKYPKANIYNLNQTTFRVNVNPDTSGYNSDNNSAEIIKLMYYLSNVSSDIRTISKMLSGHKKIEANPHALNKQVDEFKKLIKNDKRDPQTRKKNSTLLFANQIQNAPEFRNYLAVAEAYAPHQQKLSMVFNKSIEDILKQISDKIVLSDLTDAQLRHFSNKMKPFIYSRLLGVNNIPFEEIEQLFMVVNPEMTVEPTEESGNVLTEEQVQSSPIQIVYDLEQYIRTLQTGDNLYQENLVNSELNDTAYSRSRLFGQGLIWDSTGIWLNPDLLAKWTTKDDIDTLRDEFAQLPQQLQQNLIVYDLVAHGWETKKSMYPIFPEEITNTIRRRAMEFQNQAQTKKLDNAILKKAYQTIEDLEIINPNYNNFPTIFSNEEIDFKNQENNKKLIKSILNKDEILEQVNKGVPLTVQVINLDTKEKTNLRVNALPRNLDDEVARYFQRRKNEFAKNTSGYKQLFAEKILEKIQTNNLRFFEKARPIVLPKTLQGMPENLFLVSIPDPTVSEPFTLLKPALERGDLLIIPKEDIESYPMRVVKENTEKKKNKRIGRAYKTDFYRYTSDEIMSEEDFFAAYESPYQIDQVQKAVLYEKYVKDKEEANEIAKDYPPEVIATMDEKELIEVYNKYAAKDVYAYSIITTPVTLELISRASAEQSALTKVSEGNDDIGVLQSYLQTNNITATHPATQAMQRELEVEFKGFLNERRKYMRKINEVSEALYEEKFNYRGTRSPLLNRLIMAVKILFKNRAKIYEQLYGNIVEIETSINDNGIKQKRIRLLPEFQLKSKLKSGEISQAEYNFAEVFREITTELHPSANDPNFKKGFVPAIAMGRLESFGNKGLLGLFVNSQHSDTAIYNVYMKFNDETVSFKEIEDYFKVQNNNNLQNVQEYIKLRNKAKKLMKQRINEDGSPLIVTKVSNVTLAGHGMVNQFANQGWVDFEDMISMDLNKALADFTHASLFVTGNKNFQGFMKLQAKVDGLLLHNQMKGFNNQNRFAQKILKEYSLKGFRQDKKRFLDKVLDVGIKGNLLYIMGWKLFALGKGAYAIGNIAIGKYHNIKNQGGAAWLRGEKRFWGLTRDGKIGTKKALGVLNTLNFMNVNMYDEVNLSSSSGLDKIFTDLALLPMITSEKWIQGSHMLGLLTEEQWNRFDDNGNYKPGETEITNQEIVKLENEVKNAHGKGYTPTDQRVIQRYSLGRMMLQFSRFIPTMFYDRFSKEDINIYGQKHVGSLRAVATPIWKVMTGEITPEQFAKYRSSLDPLTKQRFDSGLRGLAMVTLALFAAENFNSGIAKGIANDANYLVNSEKLEYKAMPSLIRTIHELLRPLMPM